MDGIINAEDASKIYVFAFYIATKDFNHISDEDKRGLVRTFELIESGGVYREVYDFSICEVVEDADSGSSLSLKLLNKNLQTINLFKGLLN